MCPLKVYNVIPRLPEKLMPLWDVAYNFWFTWKHEIAELFSQIDYSLWRRSQQNPVWFLNHLDQEKLETLARDVFFWKDSGILKTVWPNIKKSLIKDYRSSLTMNIL